MDSAPAIPSSVSGSRFYAPADRCARALKLNLLVHSPWSPGLLARSRNHAAFHPSPRLSFSLHLFTVHFRRPPLFHSSVLTLNTLVGLSGPIVDCIEDRATTVQPLQAFLRNDGTDMPPVVYGKWHQGKPPGKCLAIFELRSGVST